MPNYQRDVFVYQDEDQIKRQYGHNAASISREENLPSIWNGHRLNRLRGNELYREQARLFDDPTDKNFETNNIISVNVTEYFPYYVSGRNRPAFIQIHRKIAPALKNALREISVWMKTKHADGKDNYVLRLIGGYCFRYKNTGNLAPYLNYGEAKNWFTNVRWPELVKKYNIKSKMNWGEYCNIGSAEYDREFGKYTDEKKAALSNHGFGTAIDINWDENPNRKTEWDMPKEIVEIMMKYGFYWGGFYYAKNAKGFSKDAMHFEYNLDVLDAPVIYFPVSTLQIVEPPLKYFKSNESGPGGFYPAGLSQNLHGGIHLSPDSSNSKKLVRCCLPGYIIAARFLNDSNGGCNSLVKKFTGGLPLGFVLVKHQINVLTNGSPAPDAEPLNLYSLYMHLDSPDLNASDDLYAKEVKWYRSILSLRNGTVVDLDPASASCGKQLWATKEVNEQDSSFNAEGREIPAVKDGVISAIGKTVPEDIKETIEGFLKGSVVTFSSPLLKIEAGEVIGKASGQIHWEFLSPAGEQSAIKRLCEMDSELSACLNNRVTETRSDNFFSMPDTEGNGDDEFGTMLVERLPEEDDKQAIRDALEDQFYADALISFFNETDTFAATEPDQAQTKDAFTYPVKLKFKNPWNHSLGNGPVKLTCSFSNNGKAVGKTGTLSVNSFDQEYSIYVPAEADKLHLFCDQLHFDPIPLDKLNDCERTSANGKELFADIIKYRWRNLVLEHLNEWAVEGLEGLIDALAAEKRLTNFAAEARSLRTSSPFCSSLNDSAEVADIIKKLLRPLTWWGRSRDEQQDPFGEQAILGSDEEEQSLFAENPNVNQLPLDAQVDNIHPVTMMWLLSLLLERKKISFVEKWDLASFLRRENQQAIAAGWVCDTKPPRPGALFYSYFVDRGYGSGDNLFFKYRSSSGIELELSAVEQLGTASASDHLCLWGDWTLAVRRSDSTPAVDRAPEPISIEKPQIASQFQISGPDKKTKKYTATFSCSSLCPSKMQILIGARYWLTDDNTKPDTSVEGTVASCFFFETAQKMEAKNKKSSSGFFMSGPFYVWTDNAYKVYLEKNFSFGEFSKYKGNMIFETKLQNAKDPKDFRLHADLSRKIQEIRDNCRSPVNIPIKITRVANNGLTVSFKPYDDSYMSNLQTIATPLCSADKFSISEDDGILSVSLDYEETGGGDLACSIDGHAFLGALLDVVRPAPGKTIHAQPVIFVPNGGHFLFERTQDQLFWDCTYNELKEKCAQDFFELTSDFLFPPVSTCGAEEFQITMGESIITSLKLTGDIKKWQAANPKIKMVIDGSEAVYGTLKGNILSEPWSLRSSRMGKTLTFSLVVGKPQALPHSPPSVTKSYSAKPELETFDLDNNDNGFLGIKGTAHCIPVSTVLEIVCEKMVNGSWVPDPDLQKTLKYGIRKGKGGGCDEVGTFTATASMTKLTDPQLQRKFRWQVMGRAKVVNVDPGERFFTYEHSSSESLVEEE